MERKVNPFIVFSAQYISEIYNVDQAGDVIWEKIFSITKSIDL